MKVEKKTYIKSLEDYNYRSIIFYIGNCREEFIAQCVQDQLGKRWRLTDYNTREFWYIANMDVDYVDLLDDIGMEYPVTILELFADEDGLYYIERKEV